MNVLKSVKLFMLAAVLAFTAISAHAVDIEATKIKGKFVDEFSFTLDDASSFEAKASGLVGGFQLLDASDNVLFTFGTTSTSATPDLTGVLAAGDYTVFFFGKGASIGKDGIGAYSFITQVLTVPEPSAAGMMFAGLGMIGFVVMRRRNNV